MPRVSLPQVEKLVARFETISTKKKPAEDSDSGEPKTQAYYVVKSALQRETLQKEGDELDTKIRKASAVLLPQPLLVSDYFPLSIHVWADVVSAMPLP